MRSKLIIIGIVLMGAIAALIMVTPNAPATPYAAPMADGGVLPTSPMGTPTYSLPLCENEDGSGQMLCVWDGAYSGDGEGSTIVAGDCSVDTVGSETAKDACVNAWGAQDGPARVDECLTIEWEISTGEAKRENGWTLTECFKVMAE